MTMIKDEKLLTEREAAAYFGWSIYKMREIRKLNEIDCIRFNERTIRYTPEQLEAYKKRHLKTAI